MKHDARHIANEFIRRAKQANVPLTNLHIQKLVYFAHARMLSIHKEPLVSQRFEAWQFGPVVPDIYHALKEHGDGPVEMVINYRAAASVGRREIDLIDRVFDKYGRMSIDELVKLTHASGGPWDQVYTPSKLRVPIPNDVIESFHLQGWQIEARETVERISRIPKVRQKIDEGIRQFERGEYTKINQDKFTASRVTPNL